MPRIAKRQHKVRGVAMLASAALLPILPAAAAEGRQEQTCELQAGPRRTVVRVVDAETIVLDDGREVRLIGALAPRSRDLSPNAPNWPPEQQALKALRGLVLGRSVNLAQAGRRSDRYGRLLAHLFIERGGTRIWVQGRLLSDGHARAYGLPGSFACMREMLAHERVARAAGTGLWSQAAYAPWPAFKTRAILRHRNTYQIVAGKVAHIAPTKARTYLNFGRDWRRDFTAGIDAKVLKGHSEWAKTIASLEGRRIEVRGWIEYRNGPYINVEHPSQIAIVQDGLKPAPKRPGGPTMSSGHERDEPAQKGKRPTWEKPDALDL